MNTPDAPDEAAKNEKNLRTVRLVWIFLIVVFGLLILGRLYSWSQGSESLTGILSPLGMIFLGFSQIVGSRRKPLYYVFLALAMIFVFSGLAALFIY